MSNTEQTPLKYAYLGDAVLEVMVRERLISLCTDTADCHHRALSYVTAARQADALKRIRDQLTTEEETFFLHARNARPHSFPQNADPYEYRLATGFEALFGWLYCNGLKDRMTHLFNLSFPDLAEL